MRSHNVSSGSSFNAALVGPGFYKLGYVTTDRDRAIEVLSEQLGIQEFAPFEPSLEVRTADGRTGNASLRCAFSVGYHIFVEVMQPVAGLVDVFREALPPGDSFAIAFHHTGVLVDDMDATLASAAALGLTPEWSSDLPNGMRVAYTRLASLGHLVEHVSYAGDSAAFLDGLAERRLGR